MKWGDDPGVAHPDIRDTGTVPRVAGGKEVDRPNVVDEFTFQVTYFCVEI